MARRIKYKIGDVFLVPLNEELSGVGRVLRKCYDTILIELYHMKPIKNINEYDYQNISINKPLVMSWCYDDGIKSGIWQIIDCQPVPDELDMPYFWTQDAGNKRYTISKGTELSFRTDNEMIEISAEERFQYEPEGIGNEITAQRSYIRRLKEAGIIDLQEEKAEES